ncbi:transposase [Sulfurimonas sp.]|uniref:transposase n=1 Tax=Sulfurimonas sp. TaxID=2022749 RepID=UPI0025EBCF68|nr:transposase [Sulfurimonas sp.]
MCKKKFSISKIQRDFEIIECFCKNLTGNQTKDKLHINHLTVKVRFEFFRKVIANFLEEKYQGKDVLEYDEYIYLSKSKKKVKKNIFDAKNFLTFNYENKVYNLLMPDLNRYKDEFLDSGAEEAHFKEFSKFMMLNKISKTQKRENIITMFWNFFEDSILKYKGINHENFFYYLKEIEFKFNYTYEEQVHILKASLYKYF